MAIVHISCSLTYFAGALSPLATVSSPSAGPVPPPLSSENDLLFAVALREPAERSSMPALHNRSAIICDLITAQHVY